GVDGVVEDRADVVAHAAVDRDVDALAAVVEPDGLDGPDPVQGGDGGSDERTAGLERQRGDGGAELAGGRGDLADEGGDDVGHGRGVVVGRVGDAEAAAEVELAQQHTALGRDLGAEAEQRPRGGDEPVGGEDLAADVGVQPEQVQLGGGEGPVDRLAGGAGGEREAELLVLVRGRDVLVAAGVHTGGDADHDGGHDPGGTGALGDEVDLGQGVDDEAADAVRERGVDLLDGLVVAVQPDRLAGHAGAERGDELAEAGGVDTEALGVRPAQYRG